MWRERRKGVGLHLPQDSSASILTPPPQFLRLLTYLETELVQMESINPKQPHLVKTTQRSINRTLSGKLQWQTPDHTVLDPGRATET